MAKFKEKHLKLRDDQRVYFGDSDDSSLWFDGSEMRIATTVSGVDPSQDYHLTTKKYVDDEIITISGAVDDHNELNNIQGGATDDYYHLALSEHTALTSGTECTIHKHDDRYYTESEVDTISGSLSDEIDSDIVTFSGTIDHDTILNTHNLTTDIDHGSISGLGDDDHPQYVPTDASRGFTATVSGVDPTEDYHLATKSYVDDEITTISGSLTDKTKTGRTLLAFDDYSKSVVFGTAFSDINYSLSVMMRNIVDSPPSIYPMIVTVTTVSGFSVLFSGDIDSNNYYLDWIARHD